MPDKALIHTIMHEKSILTLEYPKILERVAREAAFSASKELVMELQPTPDLDEAQRRNAVRLKQVAIQPAAEIWTHHALAGSGAQDDADRLTHVQFARRPDHAPIRPDSGWEAEAASIQVC